MLSKTATSDDDGLPADIWIEIALDSEPLDVISVSQVRIRAFRFGTLVEGQNIGTLQTCKRLHSILADRSTWKAILQEVMRRNGPFMVSSPPDGLTVDDLKKAATRPSRWRGCAVMSPSQSRSTGSTVGAAIPTRNSFAALRPPNAKASTYRFIPGGRFLLHGLSRVHVDTPGLPSTFEVILWDLGHLNTALGVEPVRVTSHCLASGFFESYRLLELGMNICMSGAMKVVVVASLSVKEGGVKS